MESIDFVDTIVSIYNLFTQTIESPDLLKPAKSKETTEFKDPIESIVSKQSTESMESINTFKFPDSH